MQFNVYEAKSQLSKLIERALAGEDVIIAKAGKPLVRLVPYTAETSIRKPGLLAGKITIAEDAFSSETDAEIAASFDDSDIFPNEKM